MRESFHVVLVLLLLAGSTTIIFCIWGHWTLGPWATKCALEHPSFAQVDAQGLITSDRAKRGESFSHLSVWITSGMFWGALFCSWIADYIGFQGVFWVSMVLTLLIGLVMYTLIEAPNIPPLVGKKAIGVAAYFSKASIIALFISRVRQ